MTSDQADGEVSAGTDVPADHDVVAERAITRLVHHYCRLIDDGDLEGFAALFAHGRWHQADAGAEGVLRYLAEHVHLYDGTPRTTHVTTGLTIDVAPHGRTATAVSTMQLHQGLPDFPLQIIMTSRCHDTFELVDGTWTWRRRVVRPILIGDMSRHAKQVAPPV